MKLDMIEEIEIPKGTEVKLEGRFLKVKGKAGEVKKDITHPKVKVEIKDGKIMMISKRAGQYEKMIMNSLVAHAKNLLRGANEGHDYVLKICSGHFPMKVTMTKDMFVINNFVGEKFPRKLKIKPGVEVKVEGDKVTVYSTSKELAGQTAADIEQLTRRSAYDRRIFQDGIYITKKDGKDIK